MEESKPVVRETFEFEYRDASNLIALSGFLDYQAFEETVKT